MKKIILAFALLLTGCGLGSADETYVLPEPTTDAQGNILSDTDHIDTRAVELAPVPEGNNTDSGLTENSRGSSR